MFRHKKLLIAFATALLAVCVLATGIALAETPTPQAGAAPAAPIQGFLDKVAKALGIERTTLDNALTTAQDQTLDEAVAAGKLTQEQADKIKERSKDKGITPWFFGGRMGLKGAKRGTALMPKLNLANPTVEALAQLTGKSAEEIRNALKPINTLQKFLDDNNITQEQLRNKVTELVQQQLAQAVKDGKMTQEQADKILERIKQGQIAGVRPFGRWKGMPAPTPTPN